MSDVAVAVFVEEACCPVTLESQHIAYLLTLQDARVLPFPQGAQKPGPSMNSTQILTRETLKSKAGLVGESIAAEAVAAHFDDIQAPRMFYFAW